MSTDQGCTDPPPPPPPPPPPATNPALPPRTSLAQ